MGVGVEIPVPLLASPSFVEAIGACVHDVRLLNARLAERTEDLGVADFFCTFFVLLCDEFFTVFQVLFFHLKLFFIVVLLI